MPEYEKCWACVQIVRYYPGPVTMSALDEVGGQDIGLCDMHWSWWVAYWMNPETGEPGCSAHVVTLPPPLRPIAFVNSQGNGQVVTGDACPSCETSRMGTGSTERGPYCECLGGVGPDLCPIHRPTEGESER